LTTCQTSGSTLIMETKDTSEKLVFSSTSIWLIAREDYGVFIRRECFKSYLSDIHYL
jgi:hypothetical protein